MLLKRFPLPLTAFFQALGLTVYCSLIGLLFWRGERWFGQLPGFLEPTFFLVLFVASALISAFLVLGYPLILFLERKQTSTALKLIGYTTVWLIFFALLMIFLLAVF